MKDSENILTSIKKLLGIAKECTDFDIDIMMHINTVFMILNQLGVGPKEGFRLEDKKETWDDYITEEDDLDAVKSYIHLKVKLMFDPPLNSAIIEAMKQTIDELEWRINVKAESNYDEEV